VGNESPCLNPIIVSKLGDHFPWGFIGFGLLY